jgi:hypothetical protein
MEKVNFSIAGLGGRREEDKETQSKCKEKESQYCKNSLKKRSDFETQIIQKTN